MFRRARYARRLAGVLFLTLHLVGCSQLLPRDALPGGLPPQVVLDDTPFYPQERYQCGPAALAMTLGQRGVIVSPESLVSRVYLPERQGSVAPEMVATARSYGMVAYKPPATLEALLRELAAGNAVLVLQNLGLSWLPKWHYAVAVGYDLEGQQLLLHSGITARYQLSFTLFDRTWERGGRWGLVLLPPGRLPASGDRLAYLQAAHALEQTRQASAAEAAYRAATVEWPGEANGWLALGNLHYGAGRFAEAAETLRAGLAHHPMLPALWNNLAYALAGAGCRETAHIAVSCAVRLAPGEGAYLQSRDELLPLRGDNADDCIPLRCTVSP